MEKSNISLRKSWTARFARLQPWYVLTKYQNRLSRSVYAFVMGFVSIATMTALTIYTQQPLIFPSLGPSVFLFFTSPSSPSSSPRNAILGHGTGIIVGWTSFALSTAWLPSAGTAQVAAAALSLGTISALMVGFDFPHPPAASTTLIVSLGLMVRWPELVAVMVAVLLLTVQAAVIHRISGVFYPLWRARPEDGGEGLVARAMKTESASEPGDIYADLADRLVSRGEVLPRKKTN